MEHDEKVAATRRVARSLEFCHVIALIALALILCGSPVNAKPKGVCMSPNEFKAMRHDHPNSTLMGKWNSPEIIVPSSGILWKDAVILIPAPPSGKKIIGVLCGTTDEGEKPPVDQPGHWCLPPASDHGNECLNHAPSGFGDWVSGVSPQASRITFGTGVGVYQYGWVYIYIDNE